MGARQHDTKIEDGLEQDEGVKCATLKRRGLIAGALAAKTTESVVANRSDNFLSTDLVAVTVANDEACGKR